MVPPNRGLLGLALCLMISASLAGCHGLDDTGHNDTAAHNDGSDSSSAAADDVGGTTTNETQGTSQGDSGSSSGDSGGGWDTGNEDPDPPSDGKVAVFNVDAAPTVAQVNDTVTFKIEVTGVVGQASLAEIRYANATQKPNADGDFLDQQFDGTVAGTPQDPTLPGSFNITDWKLDTVQTYHVRAHIVIGGQDHWSNEFTIEVSEEAPPVQEVSTGPTVKITIGTGGSTAPYEPATATIKVGESVQWSNGDLTQTPHTATRGDGDVTWDTGNLDNGDDSTIFQFNRAGTYEYGCLYHPSMAGTIVVEAN